MLIHVKLQAQWSNAKSRVASARIRDTAFKIEAPWWILRLTRFYLPQVASPFGEHEEDFISFGILG